jgi:hypothetical protein
MAIPPRSYEPNKLAQGDTISFIRSLGDYPATNGWNLTYELRGSGQVIEFSSTPSGDSHAVIVTAATTAGWIPFNHECEGYAINVGTGERSRIYHNYLLVVPNLQGSPADIDTSTHASRMLALIEAVQEGKFNHDLLSTEVEGTRILRLTPQQLREEYYFWKAERRREIRKANALAGRSDGRNRFVMFRDPAGGTVGQFGAMPPIYPNEEA